MALDPLSELGQRALMRAFALAGRPSEALRLYKSCADTLERELGIAPDAETQTLAETILRSNRAGKERNYHLISRINDFPPRAAGAQRPVEPEPVTRRNSSADTKVAVPNGAPAPPRVKR